MKELHETHQYTFQYIVYSWKDKARHCTSRDLQSAARVTLYVGKTWSLWVMHPLEHHLQHQGETCLHSWGITKFNISHSAKMCHELKSHTQKFNLFTIWLAVTHKNVAPIHLYHMWCCTFGDLRHVARAALYVGKIWSLWVMHPLEHHLQYQGETFLHSWGKTKLNISLILQ